MENKTLWFEGSKYNLARVIEKIADMVLDRGGKVKELEDNVTIRTRGYSEKMMRVQYRIDASKRMLAAHEEMRDTIMKAIEKYEAEYRELERLKEAAPVVHSRFSGRYGICATCLSFVLDGTFYRFSFSDNPFFPDGYSKIKLNDAGEYYGQYYGMNLTTEDEIKEYFVDELWKPCASEELIAAVAEDIFTRLMDAAPSERYFETERRRVPNTYNDGWHWETVTSKRGNEKHKIEF